MRKGIQKCALNCFIVHQFVLTFFQQLQGNYVSYNDDFNVRATLTNMVVSRMRLSSEFRNQVGILLYIYPLQSNTLYCYINIGLSCFQVENIFRSISTIRGTRQAQSLNGSNKKCKRKQGS